MFHQECMIRWAMVSSSTDCPYGTLPTDHAADGEDVDYESDLPSGDQCSSEDNGDWNYESDLDLDRAQARLDAETGCPAAGARDTYEPKPLMAC